MSKTKLKRYGAYAKRALTKDITRIVVDENKVNVSLEQRKDFISSMANIWFMRLIYLRIMELDGQFPFYVVSPVPSKFKPEILELALEDKFDAEVTPFDTQNKVKKVLKKYHNEDVYNEAFRYLIFGVCNSLYMRGNNLIFQPKNCRSELLLPTDLVGGSSIIAYNRENIVPEDIKSIPNTLNILLSSYHGK